MATVPSHVSPELVRPTPFWSKPSAANPYTDVAPKIHLDMPEIFYAVGDPADLTGVDSQSGMWVPRLAEDQRVFFLDTDHFSNKGSAKLSVLIGQDWDTIPVGLDPPDHAAFRALLNPLFAPKRIAELEILMRKVVNELIDKFAARGECALVPEFSRVFPATIFLGLLDLPIDRMPQFLEWERLLLHPEGAFEERVRAMRDLTDYLESVVNEREKRPGEDVISYAVKSQVKGRPVTHTEIVSIAFMLFLGGLDTVAQTTAWFFRHLAESQSDQQRLRDEPGLLPNAVEELLRAYPAVSSFRFCKKEFSYKGVTVKPGDTVLVSGVIASRDPSTCANPNEVILDREPFPNTTFAYGPHRCIGSHLARMELRVAIEEFLRRIPQFRIDENKPAPKSIFTAVAALSDLNLAWKV